MYYRLNKDYGFRGWKNLPFAIQKVRGRDISIFFFRKEEFRYLIKCNGLETLDPADLPEEIYQVIKKLVELKVVCESENSMERLLSYQRYAKYEARYIESVQWAITGKCNFSCRHCEVSAPGYAVPELTLERAKYIIDEIAACGIRNIQITGGEPLIRKDLEEIISYIHEKNLLVTKLYTNGALLDERILTLFERYEMKPKVQISFDGIGYHDWLRGVLGAEDKALKAFSLLKERGYSASAAMMIHRKNKESLLNTVELLSDAGVSELGVNAPKVIGVWKEYAEEYALTEDEVWQVYKDFLPKYYKEKIPILISLDGYFAGRGDSTEYWIPYLKSWEDDYDFSQMLCCKSVYKKLHINSVGKVFPCMSFACYDVIAERMPSIFTEGLTEITWHSACSRLVNYKVLDYLKDNQECMDCKYQKSCRGGCYAQNVSDTGQPGIDKRTCYFFKNIGEEAVRSLVKEAMRID
ncbi:MAG: radical SAM protein [Lachnospiraceae bacterium]|nr:radical SAM protein [Lachnospiraceae bacterium]